MHQEKNPEKRSKMFSYIVAITSFLIVCAIIMSRMLYRNIAPTLWSEISMKVDDMAVEMIVSHLDYASLRTMVRAKLNKESVEEELARRRHGICWDCRNEIYVCDADGAVETYALQCRCMYA